VDLLCAESTGGAGEEKREPGPVKHGGPPGNATRRVVAESEEAHVTQGPISLSALGAVGILVSHPSGKARRLEGAPTFDRGAKNDA
jgi:hypothetical protein